MEHPQKGTQTAEILEHLKQGHSLTPLEALNKFGCFRLGARIWDIKHLGWDVKTRNKKVGKKHVAEYWI